MSSARLPLALAVLGLAACAHTPSNTAYVLPDIRHAAPVLVSSSDDVPEGYDDHVVVRIDQQSLERAYQRTAMTHSRSDYYSDYYYYYYGHPTSGSTRPTGTVNQPNPSPPPAAAPSPPAASNPPVRHAPRHVNPGTKRSRD